MLMDQIYHMRYGGRSMMISKVDDGISLSCELREKQV